MTLTDVKFDVLPDDCPESPRMWDNLGKMICWHRRYQLGDQHQYRDPQEFSEEINTNNAVILPLYLFDHSGLTISTSSARFRAVDSAGWDWGQVGYIYVTLDAIRREYGVQRITVQLRQRVEDMLRSEVEIFNQYLQGDVYGFTLTCRKTGEVVDSCWGFYGDNPMTNGMLDHLPMDYREAVLANFTT